jgi:hypothetical protein
MSPLYAKSRSSSLMNSSSYSVSPTKPQYCLILLFGRITISRPLVKTSRFSVPSFMRRLLGIRRPSSTITASIMIRSYYVLFTLMICGLWRFVRRTIDTVRKVTGRHTPCQRPPRPSALAPTAGPGPRAVSVPVAISPRRGPDRASVLPIPRISADDCPAAPGRRPPPCPCARSRGRERRRKRGTKTDKLMVCDIGKRLTIGIA